jgi:hypothetical protein
MNHQIVSVQINKGYLGLVTSEGEKVKKDIK